MTSLQFKIALALVLGAAASVIAAAPVPVEWKPIAIAAAGVLTALAALIDPNRDHSAA